MKTKTYLLSLGLLAASFWMSSHTLAQQPKDLPPVHPAAVQTAALPGAGNYMYRLFLAPNKVYGYDIFQNGKLIFHQPALAEPAGDIKMGLTKKPYAEKAALLAIEKLKKGLPLELTRAEIIKIAAQ